MEIIVINLDLKGYIERIQCYIILLEGYNIYIKIPQLRKKLVQIDNKGKRLWINNKALRVIVYSKEIFREEIAKISLA